MGTLAPSKQLLCFHRRSSRWPQASSVPARSTAAGSVESVAGQPLQDAPGHGCVCDHHARLLRLLQHPLHQLRLRIPNHCGGGGVGLEKKAEFGSAGDW